MGESGVALWQRFSEPSAWPGGAPVYSLGVLLLALFAGAVLYRAAFALLRRWSKRTETILDDAIVLYGRAPSGCSCR